MFHRKVIIKLKFFRDISSQCYYMARKKKYVLSCCGSTLSLVYISSSIVLNLLSYLGPIKKRDEPNSNLRLFGSDVELCMRRTTQLNQTKKQF